MINRLYKTVAIALAVFLSGVSVYAEGTGRIGTLDQFTSTTTPYGALIPAVTQRIYGKPLFLTGLETGKTICTATNGLATTTGCVAGGGSGGGTWSTTTSTVAGQLINYPNNNTDIVTIGGNSTTSAEFYFDPNLQRALFTGDIYSNGNIRSTQNNYGWIDVANSILKDNNDKASVSWASHFLGDSTGATALDYQSAGLLALPAYTTNGFLITTGGGGSVGVDTNTYWSTSGLTDLSQLSNATTNFINLTSLSATAPIEYDNTTGVISCSTCGAGSSASTTLLADTNYWSGVNTFANALGISSGGTGLSTVGASSTILQSNGTGLVYQKLSPGLFTTPNVSQWTNDSSYLTLATLPFTYPFPAGATSTKLTINYASTTALNVSGSTYLTGLSQGQLNVGNGGLLYSGATTTFNGPLNYSNGSVSFGWVYPFTPVANGNSTTSLMYLYGGIYANNTSSSTIRYASTTALTVATAADIPRLSNLTSNGFVKTGSSNGTLSVDTNTYLTTAVTSVATNQGLTGGTITTTGTIGLDLTGISANNTLLAWNGTKLVATGTQQLMVGFLTATSTASSTFAGALSMVYASTTATSTMKGINLPYGGCYAVNGVCALTSLSGAASSTLLADNNTFSGLNNFLKWQGVGTSTPTLGMIVVASTTGPQLALSAGAGVNMWTFRNDNAGNLQISTSTIAGTATTTSSALTLNSTGTGLAVGTSTNPGLVTITVSAASSTPLLLDQTTSTGGCIMVKDTGGLNTFTEIYTRGGVIYGKVATPPYTSCN